MPGDIDNKYLPRDKSSPVEFVWMVGESMYIRAKRSAPALKYEDKPQEANARAIADTLAAMKNEHRIMLESGNMGVNIRAGTEELKNIREEVFELFNIDPTPVLDIPTPRSR